MVENALYLAGEEIARRCGVYETAYVTADRKFVIDMSDLKRMRMTGDEYINGLNIEKVSEEEAERLIAENKYRTIGQMDDDEAKAAEEQADTVEETPVEEEQEESEQEEEETPKKSTRRK